MVFRARAAHVPGLVGKLTARSEAHALRLSALYALLARSPLIRLEHLRSALAVWAYAAASTRLIFGARTGNRVADPLREEMTPGQRLSTTEVREKFFANHVSASNLSAALRLLQ